jgi:TatA/E family protein of Tat protein translocase
MFGTLGFSELIIILVIVLVIFGAGRLPQLGEGLGKALKGFKKEVHEIPPVEPNTPEPSPAPIEPMQTATQSSSSEPPAEVLKPTAPYRPGPELTPGTTAALMASAAPQAAQPPRPKPVPTAPAASGQSGSAASASAQFSQPPTMEDRMTAPAPVLQASYPPLPASAQTKPAAKRPSAIVNKDAVARVQAQQAAMKTNAAHKQVKPVQDTGLSSNDMQSLGESLGDTLRTFRQAAADVRNAVDPEMRTIRAEMDAAQKEIEQSMEAAKQMPAPSDDAPKQG